MVSKARGSEIELKIVDREEHERYYVEERGMDEPYVKWWSKTYDSLRDHECEISDPTLERLLGKKATTIDDTIMAMFAEAS